MLRQFVHKLLDRDVRYRLRRAGRHHQQLKPARHRWIIAVTVMQSFRRHTCPSDMTRLQKQHDAQLIDPGTRVRLSDVVKYAKRVAELPALRKQRRQQHDCLRRAIVAAPRAKPGGVGQ